MNAIIENRLIERLAGAFPRSPNQLNGLRESDAELIRLPGADALIAITTDAVVEEIEAGLYEDPYLIGWMAVMVNASDLAAVGAEPVGILLIETLKPDEDEFFLAKLQEGIRDACTACNLMVLGGDTNFSSQRQIAGTALGTIRDGRPLTRLGCAPGDRLFASSRLGLGSAFALSQLRPKRHRRIKVDYRPLARLSEGQLLRRFASCCMDTSDGVIPTLDELMQLNEVGFIIDRPLHNLLHPTAVRIAARASLPAWTMLAGPHGEFELLFTIPEACSAEFEESARSSGWTPLPIGFVTDEPGLRMEFDDGLSTVDSSRIRNLFTDGGGDPESYIAELIRLDALLRVQATSSTS